MNDHHHHHDHHHDHGGAPASVKDPVCGMAVDPATTKHSLRHEGHPYYFCSAGCRSKFEAEPGRYLSEHRPAAPAPEGTIYTCPMHPEIRQEGPGSCPICGMALEPLQVTAEAGPNPELAEMTRRFWVSLVLTLPVFILEMGAHLVPALHHLVPPARSAWIQLVLASIVVLWGGWPFFVRGWQSVLRRSLNMFTLIAMGTGIAWVYSLVAVLSPGLFPKPSVAMTAAWPSISRPPR